MSLKIHLGCGSHFLNGWENVDMAHSDSLLWRPHSADFIFTENFIETMYREDAERFLTNCRMIVKAGGVMRISTISLETIFNDWKSGKTDRLKPLGMFPKSPCRMVNEILRNKSYRFIWDFNELNSVLLKAGFSYCYKTEWKQSRFPELRLLESRPHLEDLIVEAKVL